MKNPLVSVLICVYNAGSFIEETLLSVLNQSYRNIEVLILDNASTDKTVAIIQDLARSNGPILTASVRKGASIRLIQGKKNIGPYTGLNLLLDQAKGEYIAINDHDDVWDTSKIEKQIDFLEKHKEYIGCGTGITNWYEKYDKKVVRRLPTQSNIAWHTSLIFRNKGHRYDTSIPIGTDFFFMKNILCQNKKLIYNLPDVLVNRRIFALHQNLSGQWTQKVSPLTIIKLNISFFDKLALLNRLIIPQDIIDWFWVHLGT